MKTNFRYTVSWQFWVLSMLLGLIIILFVAWTGWYVVFIGLLLVPFMFVMRQKQFRPIRRVLQSNWVYFPAVALISLTLAVLLRIFVLSVYGIPSGSMESTILPGDQILVSKLQYGPRMPMKPQEIPWFGLLLKNAKAHWPQKRLPGTDTYKRQHIMVFERKGKHTPYIKRCAGLPGDTLIMAGWNLYINGEKQPQAPGIKHTVSVYFNDREALSSWYENHTADWRGQEYSKGMGSWDMGLTRKHIQQLQKAPFVDSLNPGKAKQAPVYILEEKKKTDYPISTYHEKSFIEKAREGWQKNFFGPLVVPYKGMRIPLNAPTVKMYKQTIERHEGDSIKTNPTGITINGKLRSHYTFSHNYYFMLGDNRDFSSDSRYWGFIPEHAVIGKAVLVLFNSKWKYLKKGRLLQKVE